MPRRTAKAAPAPEPEDLEEELEDEEELEEDEEEAEAPKSKVSEVTFGASDLAKHLTKVMGKTVTPRDLRMHLRKMARAGKLDREIVPGNRTRYDWPDGLADPEVKRIIKEVKGGAIEASKKEALDKLKERKAAKDAAAPKAKTTTKKKRAPVVEEVEDDDEDFEDDDE